MSTLEQASVDQADVVLSGAGMMSATLAVILKQLDPGLKVVIVEKLESAAQESSNAWNNAGTGHAALCELNYTPLVMEGRDPDEAVAATRMRTGYREPGVAPAFGNPGSL